jgi:predicted small secreted protein
MLLQKKIISLFIFLLSVLFTCGCATVEGAGEDIETAGESIQEAAD